MDGSQDDVKRRLVITGGRVGEIEAVMVAVEAMLEPFDGLVIRWAGTPAGDMVREFEDSDRFVCHELQDGVVERTKAWWPPDQALPDAPERIFCPQQGLACAREELTEGTAVRFQVIGARNKRGEEFLTARGVCTPAEIALRLPEQHPCSAEDTFARYASSVGLAANRDAEWFELSPAAKAAFGRAAFSHHAHVRKIERGLIHEVKQMQQTVLGPKPDTFRLIYRQQADVRGCGTYLVVGPSVTLIMAGFFSDILTVYRTASSRLPIPVIGFIARGDQRLSCSMRGSTEPRIEQFSR